MEFDKITESITAFFSEPLVGFWLFASLCLLIFGIGIVLAVAAWDVLRNPQVLIVDSKVDYEAVKRYLRMSDKHKNAVDKEMKVRLDE